MPVNYLDLKNQITAYGETAVALRQELMHRLLDCRTLLEDYDSRLADLQAAVAETAGQNKGLRCAVPLEEQLSTHHAAQLPAPPCTILAADGSQINPDPHGEELYGLVNVGVFTMKPGSGSAPEVTIASSLLYDESLHPNGSTASEALIALMRDTREREILAQMALTEAAPVVTLTDGPLELFREPRTEQVFNHYFEKYLSALDEMADHHVITAGYVDRPRADLVVKMLELVSSNKEEQPFKGVSDLALFTPMLNPGERSAVFKLQSSSAEHYSNEIEKGIPGPRTLHFYYLNVGYENLPALARVEVPLWVVENQQMMDLLQSVLVEQSRQAGSRPYPYPLIRAHESAVVRMEERGQVTQMLEEELLKHGLMPGMNSNKQSHKQYRGRGRM